MLESILTVSITGLIAGFIFAMPIAGPISILIVSNALNGRRWYSNQVSIGAAFSDFVYIFIAVYGVTSLFSYYKSVIPYLLTGGAFFFIYLGYKLFRQPVDIQHFDETTHMTDSIMNSDRRGFYTGFMVNMLNPTQFIGGLISSFFVISLIASLGLNTGGLESNLNSKVKEIGTIDGRSLEEKIPEKLKKFSNEAASKGSAEESYSSGFYLTISLFYAITLSLGGLIWFYLLAWMLSRYRRVINIRILDSLIKTFGIILAVIGVYFGYISIKSVF